MGKKKKEKKSLEKTEQYEDEGKPPSKKLKLENSPSTIAKKEEEKLTEKRQQEESKAEAEKLQLLVSAFSNEQQDQYEIFRRSTFQKSNVKRLMSTVCSGTFSQNVVIAMAGMAKVYVGEIIEKACLARDRMEETGPLQPKHIREAVRKLRQSNKIPTTRYKKTFNFR